MTISDDGTIRLPRIPPLKVAGLTLTQIDAAIRKAYTEDQKILQPGREQVSVTLIRKRLYRVMVFREDSAAVQPILKQRDNTVLSRRGTGTLVELPAAENDLLHALTQSGGLPGEDARNEVWVLRGSVSGDVSAALSRLQQGNDPASLTMGGAVNIARIPLSVVPGEPMPFGPSDIVLNDGDVVYIQSRAGEQYFTGGLLPGGAFLVPRDYNVNVIQAISMAGGSPHGPAGFPLIPQFRSSSGPGNIVAPTRVMVFRKTEAGSYVKIYVDLRRAMNDPRERILIQPGDSIFAFWKPWEVMLNIGLNAINLDYIIPN